MIKAIIFDIGGVILLPRTLEGLRIKFSKILKVKLKVLKPFFREQWALWKLDKINGDELFNTFIREFDKGDELKAELKKAVYDYCKPNKPVLELIKRLKNNYKIVAFSNNAREWWEHNLKKFDLAEYFDLMVNSYEEGLAKPDIKFYEVLLKKLNLKAEECVFVDNDERNLPTAEQLGMKTILYKDMENLLANLKDLGIEC